MTVLQPGRLAIWASIFCTTVLVLAGIAEAENRTGTCQADAMLVFDASGSMGTTDYAIKMPRIKRVKQSLARVVPEVAPARRLGLIVYGEGAYDDCKSIALHMRPTANAADQLLSIVQEINPRGRTPLTESVRQAAEVLDYTKREAVVVLLTDGEETCGGDPCKTAALLKRASQDLTIHVIGYREGQSQYFNAQCMAHETGGQYFPVSTEDELIDALRKTLGCPFLTQNDVPIQWANARSPVCTRACTPGEN